MICLVLQSSPSISPSSHLAVPSIFHLRSLEEAGKGKEMRRCKRCLVIFGSSDQSVPPLAAATGTGYHFRHDKAWTLLQVHPPSHRDTACQ